MSVRGMATDACLMFCVVLAFGPGDAAAQAAGAADKAAAADLRAGRSFLPTEIHSEEEDRELLALFDGLRVADVADGMDAAGLPDVGRMDPEIRPLWRDTEKFSHRFAGSLVGELESIARLNKNPRREAGFRVLRAYDVPSVLVELGYLSSRQDLDLLMSEEWRGKATAAMTAAVDRFFATRLARQGAAAVLP